MTTVPRATIRRKVMLIGWDAADWRVIDPLLERGLMPNLAAFLRRGTRASLSTLQPPYSPMLWTSVATGKRPEDHGILGFQEPLPDGEGARPISSLSRRTRALWNMLTLAGLRSQVVGWWPSHPAEPIDGVMVSNLFQVATTADPARWPMSPATVWPPVWRRRLAEFRVHPAELSFDQFAPFVPDLREINTYEDERLSTLARLIAETASIQGAATAALGGESWDFAAIYFDGIDHFSHAFMRFHPPRLPGVRDEDFVKFQHVVTGAYRFHDMMLGTLLTLAGPETTVILMSDHGFQSDHRRRHQLPSEPAGPAREHAPFGIFAAAGPGIRPQEKVMGAGLLDVCPTILSLFGLPLGADMPGRPLFEILEGPVTQEVIPSWDAIPGNAGELPPETRIDATERAIALAQLADLGYIEDAPEESSEAARVAERELQANRAQCLAVGGRPRAAIALYEALFAAWPDEVRFGLSLFQLRYRHGPRRDLRRLLETILVAKERVTRRAREELEKLGNDPSQHAPKDPGARGPFSRRVARWRHQARRNRLAFLQLEAMTREVEGDAEGALRALAEIGESIPPASPTALYLADLLARTKRWAEAEDAYAAILRHDPDHAAARLGLGRVQWAQGRFFEAAATALDLLEKDFRLADAHFLLGAACHRLGQLERATEALENGLGLRPLDRLALRRLERIYRRLGREDAAEALVARRRRVGRVSSEPATPSHPPSPSIEVQLPPFPAAPPLEPSLRAETLLVVSGLPRSGTSMVMRMLAAGGWPVWSDEERLPDVSNPHGYFEHSQVASLARDATWLPEARGHVLKIVAPLLGHLPTDLPSRVILLRRDLAEILASQARMLERQAKQSAADTLALRRVFARQMQLAAQLLLRRRIPTLVLDHARVVADPAKAAAALNRFLGGSLDAAAMAAAVDPKLYRERRFDD